MSEKVFASMNPDGRRFVSLVDLSKNLLVLQESSTHQQGSTQTLYLQVNEYAILSQGHVRDLLPYLQAFAQSGTLALTEQPLQGREASAPQQQPAPQPSTAVFKYAAGERVLYHDRPAIVLVRDAPNAPTDGAVDPENLYEVEYEDTGRSAYAWESELRPARPKEEA